MTELASPFTRMAPDGPISPVVIAVPHAGRDYPEALAASARVPIERLRALEDRFADQLIDGAIGIGAAAIVARRARAWIDLNRDPRDLDPGMIDPRPDGGQVLHSAKMRAGLGLLPRRLPMLGELWSRRFSPDEVAARIADTHEPYHRAVALDLARARAMFGHAVLIDCHSMPSLVADRSGRASRIVIGDRFGRSAADDLVDCAMSASVEAGFATSRNVPYAGGFTLERHGAPAQGIHAIQIEFDRSLYLDIGHDRITAGIAGCRDLLADIAGRLALLIARRNGMPLAAE